MSFDMDRIVESKRAYRHWLRHLPVAQKLAMLDSLRDRTLAIRRAAAEHAARLGQPHPVQTAPIEDGA